MIPGGRHGTALALALAAALLGGCATLPPATSGPPPATGPNALPPPARPAPAPAAAVVDSGPSPEAQAVLRTIPEPLPASQRVPAPSHLAPGAAVTETAPPAGSTPPPRAATGVPPSGSTAERTAPGSAANPPPAAAPESTAPLPSPPDTGRGEPSEIPVPEPTQPLGERPGATEPAITDSMLHPRSEPPPPAAAPARADTCWRVQIVAPKEKARADHFRAAATSQLMVPFVVVRAGALYKVRSRDCMARPQAAALRARALASGFRGAFLSPGRP